MGKISNCGAALTPLFPKSVKFKKIGEWPHKGQPLCILSIACSHWHHSGRWISMMGLAGGIHVTNIQVHKWTCPFFLSKLLLDFIFVFRNLCILFLQDNVLPSSVNRFPLNFYVFYMYAIFLFSIRIYYFVQQIKSKEVMHLPAIIKI